MVKCVFCGKEEDSFKGVHFITNEGSVNFYCSSKCRKNAMKLGRDKRKVKWTEAYKLKMEKEARTEAAAKVALEAEKVAEAKVEKK